MYESRDSRPRAADCFKEALSTDLTCVEAMTSHQMLTLEEERDLVHERDRVKMSEFILQHYSLVGIKVKNTCY